MKKKLSILLAVGLLISGLTACGANSKGQAANSNEIKIGINYELSGGVASYGQSSVDGIMMAIDEINAAGGIDGKKLVPVKYDNKSEPAEAITLANKLISQDGVVAILGPATSGSFKSEISVAEKKKVPVISGSATADDVTVDKAGKKEYAFRICYTDSFQGTAMANFAAQNLSAKKAVIVKDSSSDYAKGLADNFTKTFTAAGGTIVGEEAYVAKDKDFNAILTKIKGLDFDVIYLPGYYEEAGLIIKQARALGIDKPILGADGFDSPDLTNLAGASALTKVYFTNHYSSLDKDPAVVKFIDDFKKKYNKEPNAFHALGYDLAKFVADGLKRSKSLDSGALKDALAETKDFTGVTGSFSIDENHNPVKAIVVVGLENGVQATAEKSGNK
ncbi:ABC transporter substrate-binding protein [Ruminiclostridium cellobioparum]|jgi:branched-chain amino acid transport system substrate-binding protein|uniref:Amino acid-binding protein n=1 Tax=Ruminiclostridium cellobioparum subsp. termitidis CT1112 TaxID=1195236 RepID=S0FHS0_RUMCE|nr:ABC transporter substrate-binding protein [Ruminiclostridium cellobioparum]EMS71062.1 amino acid-binding protein [Ruminiclostridium cellobioparum subsp. termitidis CT1112]